MPNHHINKHIQTQPSQPIIYTRQLCKPLQIPASPRNLRLRRTNINNSLVANLGHTPVNTMESALDASGDGDFGDAQDIVCFVSLHLSYQDGHMVKRREGTY